MGNELMKMMRYILTTFVGLSVAGAVAIPAEADEATMRLRGSDQTFTGELTEFDGKSYLLENKLFGKVYLDAARFKCISGACFNPVQALAAKASPQEDVTVEPSGSTESGTTITEEERTQLFREFLEWNERHGE